MATFTLQDTGAYLEDFVVNLEAFCQAHQSDLSPGPSLPLRGISRSGSPPRPESLPASGSIIILPLGWEEESQTPAERYLRLRVELYLVYSGLHQGLRLATLLGWADKVIETFIQHRSDFQGSGTLPYLHDLILTPLELLDGQGLVSCGKILVVGLKRAGK